MKCKKLHCENEAFPPQTYCSVDCAPYGNYGKDTNGNTSTTHETCKVDYRPKPKTEKSKEVGISGGPRWRKRFDYGK